MTSDLARRPLVRWDGFSLHVDLDMVELLANRELERRGSIVRRLVVKGEGETLELHVAAAWQGIPAKLSARVSELRIYRRHFGCRVESLHGPFGVPLPTGLVGTLAQRFGAGLLNFDSKDRILLVDLRRFLPEGLDVRVQEVQCRERWLTVALAGGSAATVLAAPSDSVTA